MCSRCALHVLRFLVVRLSFLALGRLLTAVQTDDRAGDEFELIDLTVVHLYSRKCCFRFSSHIAVRYYASRSSLIQLRGRNKAVSRDRLDL